MGQKGFLLETTHDLLSNLFKGYAATSNTTFTSYIERKQEEYEDGKNIKPTALMILADKKYKTLKIKETWNAPSQGEENILALKMEIEELKLFRKETPSAPQGNPRNKMSAKKDKPKWLVNNKTPSEIKESSQHNNHTWYYCYDKSRGKCNGKWRQHQPSKCEGMAFIPEHKRKNTTADIKKGKRLKLTKAMQTLLEQVNHEDTNADSQE